VCSRCGSMYPSPPRAMLPFFGGPDLAVVNVSSRCSNGVLFFHDRPHHISRLLFLNAVFPPRARIAARAHGEAGVFGFPVSTWGRRQRRTWPICPHIVLLRCRAHGSLPFPLVFFILLCLVRFLVPAEQRCRMVRVALSVVLSLSPPRDLTKPRASSSWLVLEHCSKPLPAAGVAPRLWGGGEDAG